MMVAKAWNGKDLEGVWQVTRKIDGVRVLQTPEGKYLSRNSKPLYNIPLMCGHYDFEVFDTDWSTTVSLVRTMVGRPVPLSSIYPLDPLDERLFIQMITNPKVEEIEGLLDQAIQRGDEGLVLRQGDKWLKVKSTETHDVEITGIKMGTGQHEGKVGAFITIMGNVGTGLTVVQREEYLELALGTIIEVECMSLTPKGKFRHPRFKRVRWDK